MAVLYTSVLTLAVALASHGPDVPGPHHADPDRLYTARADLDAAHRAARIWADRLSDDPGDFEAAWKLARARYFLGGRVAKDDVRREFEGGVEAARQAAAVAPDRPEGHFWLAANMGGLAETQGIRAGLRYRAPVKEALERVLAIEPGFLDGSADRALGRWYFKVPGLFGGSKQKSLEHLQRSLSYDPTNHASNFFLAETLFSLHRLDEAVAALRRVIEAPVHPEWEAEDLEFKQRAHYRLEGLAWKQSRPR
jgi:tetratricopeptide (TPR) repeat protein